MLFLDTPDSWFCDKKPALTLWPCADKIPCTALPFVRLVLLLNPSHLLNQSNPIGCPSFCLCDTGSSAQYARPCLPLSTFEVFALLILYTRRVCTPRKGSTKFVVEHYNWRKHIGHTLHSQVSTNLVLTREQKMVEIRIYRHSDPPRACMRICVNQDFGTSFGWWGTCPAQLHCKFLARHCRFTQVHKFTGWAHCCLQSHIEVCRVRFFSFCPDSKYVLFCRPTLWLKLYG